MDPRVWRDTFLSRAVGMAPGTGAYDLEALARLGRQNVLVVGGGAVGGRTVEKLVRLGAATGGGIIEVYDPDVAEVSNLQRQCLTAADAAGRRPKAQALVDWVHTVVPQAAIVGRAAPFTPELAASRIPTFDAVIMAADVSQPAVNLAVLQTCVASRIPVFGGLDLNRVALHWHWTPRNRRSPLLRGLFRYERGLPRHRLALEEVTGTELDAVQSGDKVHGLGWLVQMLDPADLPPSILWALVRMLEAQLRGEPGFLPQAAVAADRQAQQTADTFVDWLAEPEDWLDAASYVVFDPEAHVLDAADQRAARWRDARLQAEVRERRRARADARKHGLDAFLGDPSPAAALTRTLLGVTPSEWHLGRSPLVDETGR
ncbi:MAG: ThiF family adenylyltransferase [Myxococcota bacterium]